MSKSLPSSIRVLQLKEYDVDLKKAIGNLEVVEKPLPSPQKGEVLVRIEAASCNPSDLMFLQGSYSISKTLPVAPGFEGCGVVVSSGGGLMGSWLVGKRVSCSCQGDRDGTWAEYMVAGAKDCVPLKKGVPTEQGASMIVNPLSAVGLLDVTKRWGSRALVQNAAASQLGRMILKLAQRESIPVINLVRKQSQVDLLKSMGAKHILNTSEKSFEKDLAKLAEELRATTALEPVAGEMTGKILSAMPAKSQVVVYGSLSGTPCSGISPQDLTFLEKTVLGFHLAKWTKDRGILAVIKASSKMQKLVAQGVIQTEIQSKLKLEEAIPGLEKYISSMTDGKVVFLPQEK